MFRGRLPCPRASAGRWRLLGSAAARALRRRMARVRARVEHPFGGSSSGVFGYDMVRYRGLDKNVQRLALLPGWSRT